MRLQPTGLVLAAIALAMIAVALTLRTVAPIPAEAVSTSGQKQAPSRQVSRNERRPRLAEHERRAATDHPPVEQPVEPQTWPDAEILAGQDHCIQMLTPLGIVFEFSKPIRAGVCGAPAPIVLRRVADVEVAPPTVVNCPIAAKLHEWITVHVQPLATDVLGAPVTRIVSASGYTCRPRIGNTSGRQSEHSFANAFDISALTLRNGRTMDVLTEWGPTRRDIVAQAQLPPGSPQVGGDAGVVGDAKAAPDASGFLRKLHATACGVFSTVLGPEANEAHRNHLHLDLAPRRGSPFCE
jgi:hypothetical protein